MDELITIVDDKDNVVGTATRREAHQKGLWHRIVVVFIFNSQGQLFIQKRSPKLISHPESGIIQSPATLTPGKVPKPQLAGKCWKSWESSQRICNFSTLTEFACEKRK